MRYFINKDGVLFHTDYKEFINQWNIGNHPQWKRIPRSEYRARKREQKNSENEAWERVNNADNDGRPFKDAGR